MRKYKALSYFTVHMFEAESRFEKSSDSLEMSVSSQFLMSLC